MRILAADSESDWIPKRPRSRRGAAVVEFAVIAPFLVAIMLGMFEVTRALQVKNYLTDAARSGCRIAIQPGSTTQSVTDNINTVLANNWVTPLFISGAAVESETLVMMHQ